MQIYAADLRKETQIMSERNIENLIYQFIEDLKFDALRDWCAILEIDYQEPPLDDMYPEWESEIRSKIGDEMILNLKFTN